MPTADHIATIRARHPGILLLFRIGDFYEAYDDDANAVADALCLPAARRGPRPYAAFPRQALETSLRRLLAAGHRVALCDPVPDEPARQSALSQNITEG